MLPIATVVLAAGKGTRMKSAVPKVLHVACGKPLLAWPLDAAAPFSTRTVVVVGHGADDVNALLHKRYSDVVSVLQAEQKGTGHAVQMALPALEGFHGTVLVLYGDTPLLTTSHLEELVLLRERNGAPLALWTTELSDPTGYGRIVRDAAGRLSRIVEHKDATDDERTIHEVNPGVYAMDAAFLRTALTTLKADNAQGELYLTDVVARAVATGHDVPSLHVDAVETLGVNDRVQLAQAAAVLRARVVHAAQLDGVTFIDPASVVVDATVRFAQDVTIGPNVVLTGNTALATGVVIGAGCVLHDTTVDVGAVMHPYSVCESAVVGPRCIVGPFARLRPQAVLDEGAHVGNFVELKKTHLGKGSKANHLAYLGDSTIGAGCNIGAGTITCNYDGIGKHPTVLGDDVFIGSNSTLVAPLVVHSGAYIAAGSVVTREVPKDTLAIGRAKQENKEGYVARLKSRNALRAKRT